MSTTPQPPPLLLSPPQQSLVVIYGTKWVRLSWEEKSTIAKYLRLLWTSLVSQQEDLGFIGPIVGLVTSRAHHSPDEPSTVPNHITVRFYDESRQTFATAHMPPKVGEIVALFDTVNPKWDGEIFGKTFKKIWEVTVDLTDN